MKGCTLLAVMGLACIGSVQAYMRNQTEQVQNKLVPATVSCTVNEVFQDNRKTDIKITNTSTIEAYLRQVVQVLAEAIQSVGVNQSVILLG